MTQNHASETYVPPIIDTKYNERNYLKRSVVKPDELDMIKGGDKIDLLSKPVVYAANHQAATNRTPLFMRDKDRASAVTHATDPSPDAGKITVTLPDLV